MCGIAGYVSLSGEIGPDSIVERMTTVIAHRGPDDAGFYRDRFAALGHRRLSIIDLATGHQPMTNEDGSLWIIFNGEIFNHADLRGPLEKAGHIYKTRSDTETMLHSYEQHGVECANHFRGMFAFAIWDRERRRLFCARDRMGKKPFYYYWDGRLFAFASEIKALFEHPAISPELDESLLPEYLAFGYTSGDRTLFRGIRKLMPAHTLSLDVESGKLDVRQYWEIPESSSETRSDDDWLAECRQRLEETVRMRLMSDVPLGMFLSGGVDSSLIAALMKRMVTGPVKTFAVGYREAEFSELSYARQVAETIGTEHHEVTIGMEDFFDALPKLVWHEDEPITWPSSVSLYFVSKRASEEVKVVLTGEGSDELFGGYSRYYFYLWNQQWMGAWKMLPGPLRRLVRDQIDASPLLPANLRRKLSHTFLGRGEEIESLYLDNFYCAFPADERNSLGVSEDPYSNYRRYYAEGHRSPLARLLYADQKTYLVELLMKQDQMSMATSIESRVPFLDHLLVEFSTRVPDRLKLNGKTGKHLVKRVAEEFIPREIIYRPKMGFPTPLRQWLREPRAEPLFKRILDPQGYLASWIDLKMAGAMIDRHRRGELDATDRIWRLLNFELWASQFLSRGQQSETLLSRAR
jgi:asparagine synthase (glutamine-hydrolysing)